VRRHDQKDERLRRKKKKAEGEQEELQHQSKGSLKQTPRSRCLYIAVQKKG
jgi:hypothetical protein